MELSVIKCKFLYVECFQTFNCIHRFFFIFEVYYRIVFFLYIWQLLVASVSFLSCLLCLPPTKKAIYVFARVRLSVCLYVCEQDYSKRRAWIWMKCCVSTDVGTWTNWLTVEPDPDYSPDAGTGLLSPILYALQHRILILRKNPTYRWDLICSDAWF